MSVAFAMAYYGTPVHPVHYASLLGSVGLCIAALLSLVRPLVAARLALVPLAAVWSLYGGAMIADIRARQADRTLDLVFVRLYPGDAVLQLGDGVATLTDEEVERLRRLGLTGRLEVEATGGGGRGRRCRAVVVASEWIRQPVELPHPDRGTVLYVQRPNGWIRDPADAVTLPETIRMEPDALNPQRTGFWVEDADGSRQGGTAFFWNP